MQNLVRKLLPRKMFNQVVAFRAYCTNKIFDIGQPTASSHPELLKEGEITPGISAEEYITRRKRLLELLPENGLAIIASAPVKMMTDVVPYSFRQDADYLYVTGCLQPGGLAVMSHEFGLCMFMPETKPSDVLWQGHIAGVDAALEFFKADEAYPMKKLREILPDIIRRSSKLFHNSKTATPAYVDLESFQKAAEANRVKDISLFTHELRLIKSTAEQKLMRDSASIACQALLQTMMHSKTYPHESMLSAKVEYECRMRGSQRMAFNPVVGGGCNGSVIHYSRNDQKVRVGDFVLMDVGCELHGYVSDLTRTWPPCGKFSAAQEELYELILLTNKECIKLCKPGATIREIHNYSVEMLRKGFKELGILQNWRSDFYDHLNPTSIGHYLGMDVHDCTRVGYDRPLKPGVVITIEPGVYVPSYFEGSERFAGIGIRIEDEVLITESGHEAPKMACRHSINLVTCRPSLTLYAIELVSGFFEVLTGSIPKEINQIESLLNNFCFGSTMHGLNFTNASTC